MPGKLAPDIGLCDRTRRPSDILVNLYIFVLATFLGLEVIRRVSPLQHTP